MLTAITVGILMLSLVGAGGAATGATQFPALTAHAAVTCPIPMTCIGTRHDSVAGKTLIDAELQQFAPESATTWWAVVQSAAGVNYLVRTTDSGARWEEVRAPASEDTYAFLNQDVAWEEAGAAVRLWRTVNGGATWRRVGTMPPTCGALDFVDDLHGWCAAIGAASGFTWVTVYRTLDSGANWTMVSHTAFPGGGASTPESLPMSCDKTVTFSSPNLGWAPEQWCNGGSAVLYTSEDGGARWYPLSPVPLPARASALSDGFGDGEGISAPSGTWPDLASSISIGTRTGTITAIATSSNGGASWRAQLVPGTPRYWSTDLVDASHWRLTDGKTFMVTNDAGRHWRSWRPSISMRNASGSALTLQFLSPALGFAFSVGDGGPFWWTRDGGAIWRSFRIVAGRIALPDR